MQEVAGPLGQVPNAGGQAVGVQADPEDAERRAEQVLGDAGGEEQRVLLSGRVLQVAGDGQRHLRARPRPPGLHEAEVPRRHPDVVGAVHLAASSTTITGAPSLTASRLRTVLSLNAATSFAGGVLGLLATDRLVEELGLQSAGWTRLVSAGLVLFAIDVALGARSRYGRAASRAGLAGADVGYRWRVAEPETSTDDGATESFSPVLPDDVEEMVGTVLQRVADRELSLTTAESCTGGMLASVLTDVQDLSGVFERGFVVYSEPSKCELLGLAQADIDRCGVVSEEVAVAMAEGALANSLADIAVSTTGYADDGPEPGLVHFACARRDGPTIHREERFGAIGRGPVRIASVRVALQMIDEVL